MNRNFTQKIKNGVFHFSIATRERYLKTVFCLFLMEFLGSSISLTVSGIYIYFSVLLSRIIYLGFFLFIFSHFLGVLIFILLQGLVIICFHKQIYNFSIMAFFIWAILSYLILNNFREILLKHFWFSKCQGRQWLHIKLP